MLRRFSRYEWDRDGSYDDKVQKTGRNIILPADEYQEDAATMLFPPARTRLQRAHNVFECFGNRVIYMAVKELRIPWLGTLEEPRVT